MDPHTFPLIIPFQLTPRLFDSQNLDFFEILLRCIQAKLRVFSDRKWKSMCSLMKNMETVEVMLRDVVPTFKPGKIRKAIQKALRKYFFLLQNSILVVFQKFEKEKNYIASQKHIMSVADRSKVYNHQDTKKNSSKAFLKSSMSIMRKSIKKSSQCYLF